MRARSSTDMVGMVAMRQDGMTLDDLISTWRAGMTGVLCFLVIFCGCLACAASSSGTIDGAWLRRRYSNGML